MKLRAFISRKLYRAGLRSRLRIADLRKQLRQVDLSAVIDRGFRFLEMTFIAALIGLAYSVVDQTWAIIISSILSFCAGAYLAYPFAKWLTGGKSGTAWLAFCAFGLGANALLLVAPVQALIRATFQIDHDAAVREYARIQGNLVGMGCARSHIWSVEECIESARSTETELLEKSGP